MPASTVVRVLAGAATAAAALTLTAGTAGASDETSALVTPYDTAPGHGPSISAVCAVDGIVIGSHPWDESHRNFQIWQDGAMLANITTGAAQYWTQPVGDYRVRYAGTWYDIDGDQCVEFTPVTTVHATIPPPVTVPPIVEEPPTTTPETIPPTTTTVPPTTTTEPPYVELDNPPAPVPTLPETGSNELPLVVAGVSLMIVGGMLVARYRNGVD